VLDVLNYEVPPGFFGFTLADWDIAWNLSSSLILGIIFGTLGKRIDYIFIIGMFLLFLLDFFFTENITLIMYLNLVGFTVGGNAIGFILKLLRQRFFR
jgi:hypothetical protein